MDRWKKLFSRNKVREKVNVCTCKHGHCACTKKLLKMKIMRFLEGNHSSN